MSRKYFSRNRKHYEEQSDVSDVAHYAIVLGYAFIFWTVMGVAVYLFGRMI